MKPIGPLMREHRLIEKMLALVGKEVERTHRLQKVDPIFVDTVVDFIRTYADRTHHGKEEDILFRDLAKKPMSAEHARIVAELVEEHRYARKTVGRLVDAKERYLKGEPTLTEVVGALEDLTVFYPRHIEKEDKHFFYPILEYFSPAEQDAMMQEFWEFDRRMIHEKYGKLVEKLAGAERHREPL